MNRQRFIATVVTSIALSFGATMARAETAADMSFDGMVAMKKMDKDKDGMVSKKEFLEMMSAVWDEKAKKMSVKFDRMSAEQFREVVMYLRAGS
jgi:Ca2+-binding EF-hand superfamily protein